MSHPRRLPAQDLRTAIDCLPVDTRLAMLDGVRSHDIVRKALQVSGGNAEMEFAASLMKDGAASAEHRRRAEAGASSGSLLARNLANH